MAEPAVIRNLIYHVTPIGNYKWNLEQINKKLHLFNGKKIFMVVQGNTLKNVNEVTKELPQDVEIHTKPNNPNLRETVTFPDLLNSVKSTNPNEVTFYAHTKGVTRENAKGSLAQATRLWTECMYEHNLKDMALVDKHLFSGFYHCTGVFKRYDRFAIFPKESFWHYSGTFFWFRNRSVFTRNWKNVVQTRYGTEAYLSLLFTPTEAGCLFGDGIGNLYDLKYLKKYLETHK